MNTLGDRINQARRRAGLSQKDLAKKLDISYGYVSEIELNKKMPSDELIARIGRELSDPDISAYATTFKQDYEMLTQQIVMREGKIEINVDTSTIDLRFLHGAKKYFRVHNSLMVSAGIPVGSLVGYVPVESFDNRSVMVVRYRGEIMVRGVTYNNGKAYLISSSPDYLVTAIDNVNDLEILGKAVVVINEPNSEFLKQYGQNNS